jgi:WD40 repeat protein
MSLPFSSSPRIANVNGAEFLTVALRLHLPTRRALRARVLLLLLAAFAAAEGPFAAAAPVTAPGARETTPLFPPPDEPLPAGAVARLGTGRLRHNGSIASIDISPDGKVLVSGGGQNLVRFWDAATGRQRKVLSGFRAPLAAVTFSPDGTTVATRAAWDRNAIRLWDANSWTERLSTDGGMAALRHPEQALLRFSPDGKTLAANNSRGEIVLLDAATGEPTAVLGRHDHPNVVDLAFAADGRTLASCDMEGTARLWDVVRRRPLHVLRSSDTYTISVVFTPDGRRLLTGGGTRDAGKPGAPWKDGTIRVWDVVSGKHLQVLQDPDSRGGIVSLALAADGRTLAAARDGGHLRLWDLAAGKPLRALPTGLQRWGVMSLRFSPDGKILAGGLENAIGLWETAGGRLLTPAPSEGTDAIHALAVADDGRLLAATDRFDSVALWDLPSRRFLHRLRGHPWAIMDIAFSPGGKTVATASIDGVRLWDAASGRSLQVLSPGGTDRVWANRLTFSPDGSRLAWCYLRAGKEERPLSLCICDPAVGKELQRMDVPCKPGSPASALAFSPDGRRLTATTYDGKTCRWRAEGDRFVPGGTLWERALGGGGAIYSADAALLAEIKRKASCIVVSDLETGRLLQTIPGVPAWVRPLAFSPDRRWLACGAWRQGGNEAAGPEDFLHLWELAGGREVLRWPIPPHTMTEALAFTPDGRFLVAGMSDSTILVWDALPAAGKLPCGPERLRRLWADLEQGDAKQAHLALAELIAAGEEAVAFLAGRLEPARRLPPEQLTHLLADLDSEEFERRDKATRELEKVADRIRPDLERLRQSPSAELRRRVAQLLDEKNGAPPTADLLRSLRAVAVLEHIGTAAARDVLRRLAEGVPEARLTREAKASLERLARRPRRP